jgi:hypothetical protein
MNTYILNRAILNRDALDDNQRKAMFARLGGHGGGTAYGGSASKAADEARSAKQRAALRMGMGLGLGMIGGVGEASVAKSAVGAIDDLAWSAIFRKHGGGQPISPIQARRNELAAALRRDRELKRLDQHPRTVPDHDVRQPPPHDRRAATRHVRHESRRPERRSLHHHHAGRLHHSAHDRNGFPAYSGPVGPSRGSARRSTASAQPDGRHCSAPRSKRSRSTRRAPPRQPASPGDACLQAMAQGLRRMGEDPTRCRTSSVGQQRRT